MASSSTYKTIFRLSLRPHESLAVSAETTRSSLARRGLCLLWQNVQIITKTVVRSLCAYELVRSRPMAGNGGHGNVRLDGGISAEVEAQRGILAISPQQHSLGNLGSS